MQPLSRGSRHGSTARFAWTQRNKGTAPYGAFTPRQRPNRHGAYQCAPGGFVSGTLSIPDVPQGWQRSSRAKVIHPPPHSPNRAIASSP